MDVIKALNLLELSIPDLKAMNIVKFTKYFNAYKNKLEDLSVSEEADLNEAYAILKRNIVEKNFDIVSIAQDEEVETIGITRQVTRLMDRESNMHKIKSILDTRLPEDEFLFCPLKTLLPLDVDFNVITPKIINKGVKIFGVTDGGISFSVEF